MRLWTIHPKYLDRQGIVAVWREGLLAQEVLRGNTKGYKNHPQLNRFKSHPNPIRAISYFLSEIYEESRRRGYHFNPAKFDLDQNPQLIQTTTGQLEFEINHLLIKLEKRSRQDFERLAKLQVIEPHPLFKLVLGEIEEWEKGITRQK